MEEISVVIPIMINYPNRKQNVECIVNYLLRYPYLHIDVLEAGKDRFLHLPAHPRLRYTYIPDDSPVFYHTYYRNCLLQQAEYPIVGVWDADAIVSEEQFLAAADYIRRGAVMCFPYDGDFRYLSKAESQAVRADMNQLRPDSGTRAMGRPSVGGIFFVNRDIYLRWGGDNECFYGWSPEDVERVKRLEILELPIARTSGSLYHLFHERDQIETPDEFARSYRNRKALIELCHLSKAELEHFIIYREGIFSYMKQWCKLNAQRS